MTQEHSKGAIESILEQFGDLKPASQPAWLAPLRKAGLAAFAEQGFPTLCQEDWRFTNVAPIEKLPFHPAPEVAVNGAESKVLSEAPFTKLPGHRLVFVNGFFSEKLSSIKPLPEGARVESLAAALKKDGALIEQGWYGVSRQYSTSLILQTSFVRVLHGGPQILPGFSNPRRGNQRVVSLDTYTMLLVSGCVRMEYGYPTKDGQGRAGNVAAVLARPSAGSLTVAAPPWSSASSHHPVRGMDERLGGRTPCTRKLQQSILPRP